MAIAKLDLGNVKGEQGVDGQAATITIGSVKTGDTGTPATVTNSGDERDAILNFTLPRGERGESGIGMPTSGEQPNSLLLCDEHTRTKWVTIDEAARTLFNQQSSIRAEVLNEGETLDNYRLTSDRPRSIYYCPTDGQASGTPNAPIKTKFLLYVDYSFGTKDCISQTVIDAATGQRWYRIYWLTGGTWTSWRLLDVDCYSKTQTYTQDEINQRLAQKVNSGSVYTTAQTYSKSEVDSKLAGKADYSQIYRRSETYSKGEVNELIVPVYDPTNPVQYAKAWNQGTGHNLYFWANAQTATIAVHGITTGSGSWDKVVCPFAIPKEYRPAIEMYQLVITNNGGSHTGYVLVNQDGQIIVGNAGSSGSSDARHGVLTYALGSVEFK